MTGTAVSTEVIEMVEVDGKYQLATADQIDPGVLARMIRTGDLQSFSEAEIDQMVGVLCREYKLNPLIQPFDVLIDEEKKDGVKTGVIKSKKLYVNSKATPLMAKNHGLTWKFLDGPKVIKLEGFDQKGNPMVQVVAYAMIEVIGFDDKLGKDRPIQEIAAKKLGWDWANDLKHVATQAIHRGIKKWGGLALPDADDHGEPMPKLSIEEKQLLLEDKAKEVAAERHLIEQSAKLDKALDVDSIDPIPFDDTKVTTMDRLEANAQLKAEAGDIVGAQISTEVNESLKAAAQTAKEGYDFGQLMKLAVTRKDAGWNIPKMHAFVEATYKVSKSEQKTGLTRAQFDQAVKHITTQSAA